MENYFSKNLKALRMSRGWTQEQLSKKVGITRSAINNWENNISEPNLNYIKILTDVFELSQNIVFDDIFRDVGKATIDRNSIIKAVVLGKILSGTPVQIIKDILGGEIPVEWITEDKKHFKDDIDLIGVSKRCK